METHVDINKAKDELAQLVDLVKGGTEVVIEEGDTPVARITPIVQPKRVTKRIAGLQPGSIWTSDDFDEPLPEDFLLSLR